MCLWRENQSGERLMPQDMAEKEKNHKVYRRLELTKIEKNDTENLFLLRKEKLRMLPSLR